MSVKKPSDERPIFVCGPPRSGSTWFAHLLSSHPNVLVTNETRVMVWFSRCHEGFEGDLQVNTNKKEFVRLARPALAGLVVDYYRLLRSLHGKPSARRWGDKYPHYVDPSSNERVIADIEASFPLSQHVLILRDPRAVARSILRLKWAPIHECVRVWRDTVLHGKFWLSRLGPSRFRFIRYEDLLGGWDRAGAAIEDVFRWLGEPPVPAVRKWHGEHLRTPFSLADAAHIGERPPEEGLDPEACKHIESELRQLMREFGYEPAG